MADPDSRDGDFLPPEPQEPAPPVSSLDTPDEPASPIFPEEEPVSAPIGPGLAESLLWVLAFFMFEIAGSAIWTIPITVVHAVTTGAMPTPDEIAALLKPVMPWMIGSIKLAEVIGALLAIRLRFGTFAFALTGFRRVPIVHAVVLALAVLPTAFLSGQSFALLQGFWQQLVQQMPGLAEFDKLSSIEAVQDLAVSTPLIVLIVIIAVFPALNEEFVFRAAIGRGLLARYGIVGGIALTSIYFAAVHLHPVHALALLPLSVLMHVGYLSSGSIWAPVGVHFLNNALSVVLMKLATYDDEFAGLTTDVTQAPFSPLLFLASAACVASSIWLLMQLRVRWTQPNGQTWRPEFASVEPPIPRRDAVLSVPAPSNAAVVTAALVYVLYPVALVGGLMLQNR